MAKYDVELITDKHGKPMPQYFDEVEKKMKPITKDNFDGTINGSVDVEFPDVQKVEVTNQVDEVSIKELPNMSGTVEVTNLPHIQDVNVTNAIETVSIDNLPSDYPDQAVEARLQAIEQTQSQILDKLNDTIDTRLTGSIMEDSIPTNSNLKSEMETLIDSQSIEAGGDSGSVFMYPNGASEIYLFIQIDAQPWALDYRNQFGSLSSLNGFPNLSNVNETHSRARPALSFPIGYNPSQGVPAPGNMKEAKDWGLPITDSEYFRIRNQSDQPAVATVNILRIWR